MALCTVLPTLRCCLVMRPELRVAMGCGVIPLKAWAKIRLSFFISWLLQLLVTVTQRWQTAKWWDPMIVIYHNLLWSCDVEGYINAFHLPKGFRHLYLLICSYQHLLFGGFFFLFCFKTNFQGSEHGLCSRASLWISDPLVSTSPLL